ncbi:MAG: ATP phosphoribosyltransferase [Chloroflexi bacterium]|nr:ATP phosphoribosyltransferase [Chloroflexota bacterium]
MTVPLTIALPKGKILSRALSLLEQAGIDTGEVAGDGSRRLIFSSRDGLVRYVLAKDSDVPVYVEQGAADVGIVGQDVIEEMDRDVYEPLQLGLGYWRLVVAGPVNVDHKPMRMWPTVRVATKYPRLARQYFVSQGLAVELIPLHGSIELAPILGLADLIVDVVETGRTLQENGLVEWETIMACQACLIVNRASHKMRLAEITHLIEALSRVIAQQNSDKGPVAGDAGPPILSSFPEEKNGASSINE